MNVLSRLAGWLWRQPHLLLFLTVSFWSGNIVLGRAVADVVPPVTLAQIRWIGAFLIVLPFAWPYLRSEWKVIRAHFGILTILSFAGITSYNTLAYWGLQHTEAVNGNLMQTTAPVLIAFWSLVLYRDPLSRNQALGIVVAAVGVVVIVTRGDPAVLSGLRFNVGDIAFVGALALYALYTALLRSKPPLSAPSFLAVTMGWGSVLLLPAFGFEILVQERAIAPGPLAAFGLVYVVLFPSLFAYLCYNRAVELVGANRAAPSFFLFPVIGSALAIGFLGERLQAFHLVGTALILAGVFIGLRGRRNRVAGGPSRT